MNTAYSETLSFPAGLATAPLLAELIDATIKHFTAKPGLSRLLLTLQFPAELEAMYEAETKQARVRELCLTQSAAVCSIFISTIVIFPVIFDVRLQAAEMLFAGGVIFGLPIPLFGRLSGRTREMLVFISCCFINYIIVAAICLSRLPTSEIALVFTWFGMAYAITTLPLRFPYAVAFSLFAVVQSAIHIYLDPAVTMGAKIVLIYMGLNSMSTSLLANYRMERNTRLGYLLASKEALRLFALNRDREKLEIISETDAMTGLANRGHFDRRLTGLFVEGKALEVIHLILLDVDFFKRFNDQYGHPAGDACLRTIAHLLKGAVRGKDDVVFRYGGEEFGALLVGLSAEQVAKIAERIRASVQEAAIAHVARDDDLAVVTVSVGIAHVAAGANGTPQSLIESADHCLYLSKHGGRNRVSQQ